MTAPSGPDPASAYGHDTGNAEHTDSAASRQLIATAVGVDSPAVRALADWLIVNGEMLEAILDASLANPDRLEAVRAIGLLDGGPHEALDSIAQMTAEAIGTPLASVSLVLDDRQIDVGCNVEEALHPRTRPLDASFSKFVVSSGAPLIVNDATRHPLLADHPSVQAGLLRAFAGIPMVDGSGYVVGTVSVWDSNPHHWTSGQVQLLNDLTDVACASIFGEFAFRPATDAGRPGSRPPGKLRRIVSRRRG